MFRNKNKGFISLYILLLGMLCALMLTYCFELSENEKIYTQSNKKLILDENTYNRNKEILFSLLNSRIETEIQNLNSEKLNIFLNNIDGYIVNNADGNIHYDKSSNRIVLETYYYDCHRNDYYYYRVSEAKVIYEYNDTIY